VAPLEGDRWLHADMTAAIEMLREGRLLRSVEAAVGMLQA
jgi:hypothetical protein